MFSGNLHQVKASFHKSIDINRKNQLGQTLLYHAAFKGYTDIVQFLLDNGADMMIADDNGNFPIHTASNKGQVRCVELLIKKGANVDLLNRKNLTPLHFAVCGDQYETTKLLINYGANVNSRNKGNSYLYNASSHGNLLMVELLLQCGAIIDIPGRTATNSALHVASTKGHYKVISCLLNRGASLTLKDEKFSPLFTAIHHKRLEAVDVLLDAGADPNVVVSKEHEQGQRPLHHVAYRHIGDLDYMSRLVDHGADINVLDKRGLTPLHLASTANNLKAVEYLLSRGADANIRTKKGSTALSVAKSEEMKSLLRKYTEQDQSTSPNQSNLPVDSLNTTNTAYAPPQSIATAPPLDEFAANDIPSPLPNLFEKPLEAQLEEKRAELLVLKEKTVSVETEIQYLEDRIEAQQNQDKAGFSLPTNHLECPICLEIPYPPTKIFQCEQGHIFCEVWKNKGLQFCPECRVELDGTLIRNRRLEDVIHGMTNKPE